MNAALCVYYLLKYSEGKKFVVITDYKENQQKRKANFDPCKKCFAVKKGKPMGIWVRNIAFFLANFRICDFAD
jgi:hypothetical protein